MTERIFINYRRGDDSGFAQALFLSLRQAFSPNQLFMDVDSIEPGEDFVRLLESQIAQCTVVLALIGKGWTDVIDEIGHRRLDDPDDFVRIELSSALRQDKRVIPILLPGAAMPSSEHLPDELKPLTRRQAVRLNHERFGSDTQGLITVLQRALERPGAPAAQPPTERLEPPAAAVKMLPIEPRDVASGAPATMPAQPRPASAGLSIAARIEAIAERHDAFNVGTFSLLSAVLLLFGSYVAGVIDVSYKGKQVGFVWAPNWSINYLVLFAVYNALFCVFAGKAKDTLQYLHARNIVVREDAGPLRREDVLADWRGHLRGISATVWILAIAVPSMAIFTWLEDCYRPLQQGEIGTRMVDWSNIAIVQPEISSKTAEIAFTAAAYVYLGISIWIYLFVLAYAATYAWYLYKLSRGVGGLRLVVRHGDFENALRDILRRIFVLSFLGYIAAYLMRLQAAYLQAPESNLFQFLFATELHLFWPASPAAAGFNRGAMLPASWAGWVIFICAAIVFGLAFSMLQAAYHNARDYTIANVNSETWRRSFAVESDEREIHAIAQARFLRSVTPDFGHYLVASLLMLASNALPMIGSLFLVSLLYTVSSFALQWPRANPRSE